MDDRDVLKKDQEPTEEFGDWMGDIFDDREIRLIENCNEYVGGDPAGLPGHNLMIIVSKLHAMLKEAYLHIEAYLPTEESIGE